MIFSLKRRYSGTPHQTIQASQILFTKRMDFKAELLQLNRTQFPSLGIFASKKSWKWKKLKPLLIYQF